MTANKRNEQLCTLVKLRRSEVGLMIPFGIDSCSLSLFIDLFCIFCLLCCFMVKLKFSAGANLYKPAEALQFKWQQRCTQCYGNHRRFAKNQKNISVSFFQFLKTGIRKIIKCLMSESIRALFNIQFGILYYVFKLFIYLYLLTAKQQI